MFETPRQQRARARQIAQHNLTTSISDVRTALLSMIDAADAFTKSLRERPPASQLMVFHGDQPPRSQA